MGTFIFIVGLILLAVFRLPDSVEAVDSQEGKVITPVVETFKPSVIDYEDLPAVTPVIIIAERRQVRETAQKDIVSQWKEWSENNARLFSTA